MYLNVICANFFLPSQVLSWARLGTPGYAQVNCTPYSSRKHGELIDGGLREGITQTGYVKSEGEDLTTPPPQKNLPPSQCKSYTDALSDTHFTFSRVVARGRSESRPLLDGGVAPPPHGASRSRRQATTRRSGGGHRFRSDLAHSPQSAARGPRGAVERISGSGRTAEEVARDPDQAPRRGERAGRRRMCERASPGRHYRLVHGHGPRGADVSDAPTLRLELHVTPRRRHAGSRRNHAVDGTEVSLDDEPSCQPWPEILAGVPTSTQSLHPSCPDATKRKFALV
jgi:hypothetical protein